MTRDEATQVLANFYVSTKNPMANHLCEAVYIAIQALKSEPKRGRWIRKESKRCYWFECSECGYPPPLDKFKREWFSEYCPNCGARMDL